MPTPIFFMTAKTVDVSVEPAERERLIVRSEGARRRPPWETDGEQAVYVNPAAIAYWQPKPRGAGVHFG